MAYIGAEPLPGQNREVDDISSSFNGSTTAFTLQVSGVNVSPETANNILVNIGGVIQNPGTDYTIAASTLTFTTAPASGLSFFGLVLGAGINTATVADDTIGASKLIDTAVTAGSYTTADITVDAQGRITAAANGTIATAEIADGAVNNAKVNASAAIAGTKISPDFGSQNIVTTGGLTVDTTTLKVDASNNRVGIGTASPSTLLHANLAAENGSIAQFGLSGQTNNQSFIIKADDSDSLFTFRLGSSNSTYPALRFNMGADAEAMRLTSDGKVGIGTSSPVNLVDISSATNTFVGIKSTNFTTGNTATLGFAPAGGLIGTELKSEAEADFNSGSDRDGKFYIRNRLNGTFYDTFELPASGSAHFRSFSNTGNHFQLTNSTTSNTGTLFNMVSSRNSTNGSYFLAQWGSSSTTRFQVLDSGNCANINNSFSAISDQTLKENIVDAGSQWNDIKNLKVRKFNFIETTDPDKKTMLGVVAQEAETVCPNLVETILTKQNGEEKEVKSFKYSILYMKAIKCLQEAQAKIETLETKVAALEAA